MEKLRFFIISIFLALLVSGFASADLPAYCTTTGSYAVCTDQNDYSPESTVRILGAGFDPGASLTVKATPATALSTQQGRR